MADAPTGFLSYAVLHAHEVLARTGEHIQLAFFSLAAASIIGIALGLCAFYWRRLRRPILLLAGTLQTVPGIALLALLLVLFHRIGALPALVALTLYALLPIVSGTLTGLEATSPLLIESAESLGLTRWQQMRHLRLPLAMPQLIGGIRVAAMINIGMVTMAAFIGAGGLGQLINRGLFLSDSRLILLGAIPAALLAIAVDAMISFMQRAFFTRNAASRLKKTVAALLPVALLLASFAAAPAATGARDTVRIGSKNFTEQLILGEILAQTLEKDTSLAVERKFGLGGSLIAHQALQDGRIDMYVEYSGTALATIFRQPFAHMDAAQVLGRVCDLYRQRYDLHCLPPLGFNDSYALAMRRRQADALGIRRLSQLGGFASRLRAGFDFEFAGRPDGYPKLKKEIGLSFASVKDMEPGLMYEALHRGAVDIISAYSTDGRLESQELATLNDDIHFFPPYDAFIVVSGRFMRRHPEAVAALEKLSAPVSDAAMRRMNFQADVQKRDIPQIVCDFLAGN